MELLMDIKTKLNLGDRLYHIGCIKTFTNQEECLACDGKGIVYYKDNSSGECPRCRGKGYKETCAKMNWCVLDDDKRKIDHENHVEKISISVSSKQPISIMYSNGEKWDYCKEKYCFSTIEEAEYECIRLNSESTFQQ